MTINKHILDRWSPVAFSERAISEEVIHSLFEAAKWAPSGFNGQPWHFIWGEKGDATYGKLYELINESNKQWAKTAPVLILSIAETVPHGRDSVNRYAFYETGMAVGNLLIQATECELFVHQMGGYDVLRAKEIFFFPETFEAVAMMAVGYKGDPGILPLDIAAREQKRRERKALNQFVFRKGLDQVQR